MPTGAGPGSEGGGRGAAETHLPQHPRPRPAARAHEVSTGLRGDLVTLRGALATWRDGLFAFHDTRQDARRNQGQSGGVGVCGTGLQESLLFLLFFRKEGVRNFFFFLEGDLPGDPSLPGSTAAPSSAAGEVASSAAGAEAGSGLATGDLAGPGGSWASQSPSPPSSSVGKPSTSEGSSGDRSGRVGLKVAASLSSPEVASCGRSGGRGMRNRAEEQPLDPSGAP